MSTPDAAAVTPPFLAYIARSERVGSDTWRDYQEHLIVWSVFDGWALTSPRGGGGNLRVICADILIREPGTSVYPNQNGGK